MRRRWMIPVMMVGLVVWHPFGFWMTDANGASASGSTFDFGHYHALVIGNADYEHLPDLQTPVDDAEAVASLLRTEYGFTVQTLINAERDHIIVALGRLRAQLTEQDNLLIYYAGHGHLDKEADRGYWLPIDAKNDTITRWISNATITDFLKAMKTKHVLVVADSCYSGTLTRDIGVSLKHAGNAQAYQLEMASKRSRTALTSGGLEPVLDGGGSGHSIFAKTFLAVLRENSGVMEGQSVFEQLRRPVLVNAPQEPKYSDIRFTRHEDGDFLFVRTGSALGVVDGPSGIVQGDGASSAEMARMQAQFETFKEQMRRDREEEQARREAERQEAERLRAEQQRILAEQQARLEAEREQLAAEQKRLAAEQARRDKEAMVVAKAPAFSAPQRMGREITGKDGVPMVLIPEGEFMMGSPDGEGDDNEHPRHQVHLDAFYLDQYEVTTSRYGAFMRASGRDAPKYWKYARQVRNTEKPVVGVDWHDANAYCEHYGKRLPTEAEWEKAARGTDGRTYPWGNDAPTWRHANFNHGIDFKDYGVLTTVGSREAGKSPYEVYDMAGNVWEWTADWYGRTYYQQSPDRNPTGPSSGDYRVFRGGGWFGHPLFIRSANRNGDFPSTRFDGLGFRCAQDAP